MSEKDPEDIIDCDVHGSTRYDQNHIIPWSRGGKSKYFSLWQRLFQWLRKLLRLPPAQPKKNNIHEKACIWCHHGSHQVTANKTPDEIINHYVNNLWNGQIRWVFIYLVKHLLRRLCEILHLASLKKKWGLAASPALQTTRLRRSLEEEKLIRKIIYELGIKALKGDLQIRKRMHELGLEFGDLCRIDHATKELIGAARMNGGKTRRQLLEELLEIGELGPTESISPVIWSKRGRSD